MTEPLEVRIHVGLFLLGFLFFLAHVLARYYVVLVLLPQGIAIPAMIAVRDNLLQFGVLICALALVIPSAGFKKDEERIMAYIASLTTIIIMFSVYLNSLKSISALYVFYNSAAILLAILALIFLGYFGFRGRGVSFVESYRIAMTALTLVLLINLAIAIWSFSITSVGRTVAANFDILRDHSTRYSIWVILAALFLRFSSLGESYYRRIVLGLVISVLMWTFTFGLYAFGIQIQIISGIIDTLIGLLMVVILFIFFGLNRTKQQTTPVYTLMGVSLTWFIIAGGIGLYMTIFFLSNQLQVQGEWRLFHLINANWSLLAGLGAVALSSTRSSNRLKWLVTILFSAGMIKAIITYSVNVINPNAATNFLLLGEPFLTFAFIITACLLFVSRRQAA